MLDARHTGCRLIHGESDGLPGVVADRYGDTIVLQLSAAGAERWRDAIVAALAARLRRALRLRALRRRRARTRRTAAAHRSRCTARCPAEVLLVEDGLRYRVDVVAGQKTGFYLDQRDKPGGACARSPRDATMLNVFCYTRRLHAGRARGRRASRPVDRQLGRRAGPRPREPCAQSGLPDAIAPTWIEADAFAELRKLRDRAAAFDLIVLDPPKFAPTAAHAERAARAYKDVNLLALKLLRPAACSRRSRARAGSTPRSSARSSPARRRTPAPTPRSSAASAPSADHPVALAFPEGEYLKGLLIRKAA